jgi:CheY-like chemotaxis protein
MTILYVDDDIEDLEIFQDAVQAVDPSIQYISATNANDAFDYLNKAERLPDHIILDINMPGMDGKLCLQELRKDQRFKGINVLIYSTNSFPKDLDEIEALGATFIKKANSFNDLCQIIRNLIGNEFFNS